MVRYLYLLFIVANVILTSCSGDGSKQQFVRIESSHSKINFRNQLSPTQDFNIYKYRNFYNGGGVAIGDINNDGLADIYFTANQSSNKLYLNKGNLVFEDITEKAGISGSSSWSTGVSMVDINGDGLLDIYVCNSGNVKGTKKANELFINNGGLTFKNMAKEYNLDDQGYSTHSTFFDYDKDGDLDAYVLNNSFIPIGTFNLRKDLRAVRDSLGGDKLYRNDGGVFTDVSESAGIYGSVIGFGLGVTAGDINQDGWEDLFISNDFFERDYLYINNQDGTFSEKLTEMISSISAASMGAEMVDVNNDGFNDLFVTEMLPFEYERLKSITTFEGWDKYKYKLANSYYHQFTRNVLQRNNGLGNFDEIGRYSNVHATDWSWGCLFFDVDNDGLKDLFVANGLFQDLTDQDYLQYISNEEVISSITSNKKIDFEKLINLIPSRMVENKAFINKGDFSFYNDKNLGLDEKSFSNGAAYGDLDNDGDLDLVVNNTNMEAFIYRNDLNNENNFIKIKLIGEGLNTRAIGSKIYIKTEDNKSQYYEVQPSRGFQSCVDNVINIGIGKNNSIDVLVVFPNNKFAHIKNSEVNTVLEINQKEYIDTELVSKVLINDFFADKSSNKKIFNRTTKSHIEIKHNENPFSDFNKNRLFHQMYSNLGPKVSVGKGLEREFVFVGGSKGSNSSLYELKNGKLILLKSDLSEELKQYEDHESLFFDADGDLDLDLYVSSGGIENTSQNQYMGDRLYFQNEDGYFEKKPKALDFNENNFSSSAVINSDIDGDGDYDLFVGERFDSKKIGNPSSGYILINDGKGNFTNQTAQQAPELVDIGMITDAVFYDWDNDNDDDLMVTGEFMGIEIFENNSGKFKRIKNHSLSNMKGWWNKIELGDLNNDGKMDVVIGNHGLNSVFKASKDFPIYLYSNDFDSNGTNDPIYAFKGTDNKTYPYALRHDLISQMKILKDKYPDYNSFKDSDIEEILDFSSKLKEETIINTANWMLTTALMNTGGFEFEIIKLPYQAQLSSIYAIKIHDFDGDGDNDILMGGNQYNVKPEVGKYDASNGVLLLNLNGEFKFIEGGMGFFEKGQIRDLEIINDEIVVSKNNALFEFYKFK